MKMMHGSMYITEMRLNKGYHYIPVPLTLFVLELGPAVSKSQIYSDIDWLKR